MQADVNVRTLRAQQARDAIANQVEIKRGEVRGITLTIPLLTDANSYLVVRVPDAAVKELIEKAKSLPEAERPDFIREWVLKNQRAIIGQYVSSGGKARQFRYDVVPAQAVQAQPPSVTAATPRRIEPSPPPVAAVVPRREAEANLEPDWWQGGQGTKDMPYRIRLPSNRANDGIAASQLELPFAVKNVGRFMIDMTLSQVAKSRFEATYHEIFRLIKAGYARTEEGRGSTIPLSSLPSMAEYREKIYSQLPADMRKYAESH